MTTTVFIADDHEFVRRGLRAVLSSYDEFQVVGEAATGRQAVQQVVQLLPNVAVLDIAMPELNGIEATRQIRQQCPATQVIVLTMHASSEHVFHALEAGALGYVLKDAAAKELVEAVRAVATGQRYLNYKITDQVVAEYLSRRNSSEHGSPLTQLNEREREILQLVVESKTSAEIAEIVSLSVKTVESYRSRMMQKLDIKDIPTLVKFAIQHGITSIE